VTEDDIARIEAARTAKAEADANWRNVVLEIAARSSVRAAAREAGISPDTIMQWKKHTT
jgi:hypothetical protein